MKFFSSRNSLVTFLTGISIFLFLLILFSDQLHLWPFFRRPTVFKYFASDFSDNIAVRDLHGDLSSFLPIDVVYTWVNGSDPLLINRLSEIKRQLSIENDTSIGYNFSLIDTLNDRAQIDVSLSPNGSCILRDCVPFNVLVLSYREGLARALKNNEIFHTIPAERIEKVIQSCETVNVCPEVVTFVKMSDIQDVNVVLSENITFDGEVVPAVRSFVTSQKVLLFNMH